MTIVNISSTWSAGSDQLLNNLLHINRLLSGDSEICDPPTVLRPDNASCSERCRITLTACSKMLFTEVHIVCSARHMEVYEGQDSYLETVKGKLKCSNVNSLYWHTYKCVRPLETVTVKFVSLQDKEKLDVLGIWLTLDERHQSPDNSKLVNMEEVDRMLIHNQVETQGQAMLRQLISSLPANASTSTKQTNPLLPMMLQLFTQSTASQSTDTTPTTTSVKQLLCTDGNKDSNSTSNVESNICTVSTSDLVQLQKEKFSGEELSKTEKEQPNSQAISSCMTCTCGANVEAKLTSKLEAMESQLQTKLQEMHDYRYHIDKKLEILENKLLDLMKENNYSQNEKS